MKIDVLPCAYCKREMNVSQLANHERVCIANPDVVADAVACLRLTADGLFLGTAREYDEARDMFDDAPNSKTLCESLGCGWRDLAHFAGLRHDDERLGYTFDEMRKLSAAHHDGQVGPSSQEWRVHYPPGALTHEALAFRFGSWAGVLEAAGLRYESRGYYIMHSRALADGGDERVERYVNEQTRAAREAWKSAERRGLLAIDRGVKQVFNWSTMRPEPCQVWELR